ncbi:MAG TPA: hypothetical protein VML55_24500 [Planctomycetaceae bacterium]|nr:hypothetical protein [Planctomycetaceae bacterium]
MNSSVPIADRQIKSDAFGQWLVRLEELRSLAQGWDSYSADPPSQDAIARTEQFLSVLQASGLQPTRIDASVMGGVGITHRKGRRKVYVEFYNDGRVHALFSDRTPNMFTTPVDATPESYAELIAKAREYLDG